MAFKSIDAAISAAGPGGTVLLLADKGAYNVSTTITIAHGGTAAAPVTVKGVDSSGNAADIQIYGSRPNFSPTMTQDGNVLFKLLDGANNLIFDGFDFHNVQMAFRLGGNLQNVTIQNMTAENVAYFVGNFASGTNTAPSVTGLKISNVEVHGFEKAAVLLQYNTNNVTIDHVLGDSEHNDGDIFAMGIHMYGTVHNVMVSNCTMMNCVAPGSSSSYWNGDGYTTENGVYSVKFLNCVASGNGDAGFDIKSASTVLENCTSEDNGRNFRFWTDVQLINSYGIDPHVRGGTATQAQIWAGNGARVTVTGGDFVDAGSGTIVFITDGGYLTFKGTEVTHAASGKLTIGANITGLDPSLIHDVSATGFYSTNGEIYLGSSPPSPTNLLTGTTSADTLIAATGADWTIDGLAGNDSITGNSGNDKITGGSGNDTIKAGGGDDSILFDGTGNGVDNVDGGLGYDKLVATKSSTNIGLSSVTGVEEVSGNGFGSVWVVGSTGNDLLDFTDVRLTNIQGIKGDAGNDVIYGSAGDDVILGGKGLDTMRGNAGADMFKYSAASETTLSAPDKILDFQAGVDHLDLATIDANASLSGNQAFKLIGSSGFTKHAGELRVDYSDSAYTKVIGDTNGDGVGDFAIQLTGHVSLTSADFIF